MSESDTPPNALNLRPLIHPAPVLDYAGPSQPVVPDVPPIRMPRPPDTPDSAFLKTILVSGFLAQTAFMVVARSNSESPLDTACALVFSPLFFAGISSVVLRAASTIRRWCVRDTVLVDHPVYVAVLTGLFQTTFVAGAWWMLFRAGIGDKTVGLVDSALWFLTTLIVPGLAPFWMMRRPRAGTLHSSHAMLHDSSGPHRRAGDR